MVREILLYNDGIRESGNNKDAQSKIQEGVVLGL
jgi:hypothetical protein